MVIEDYIELLALHRALLEAKFSIEPLDLDMAGSPIVATLANRIVEEIEKVGKEDWSKWRTAEHHEHRLDRLVQLLGRRHGWKELGPDDKRRQVVDGLAPLLASDDSTIDALIAKADLIANTE